MPLILPIPSTGDRRYYVRIDQLTTTSGPSGAPVPVWTVLAYEWMAKGDLQGTERFTADQIAAGSVTRWVMPWRATMDPDTVDVPATRRLQFKARAYDIQSAQTLARLPVWIELVTVAASQVA